LPKATGALRSFEIYFLGEFFTRGFSHAAHFELRILRSAENGTKEKRQQSCRTPSGKQSLREFFFR
jgi:hypothetical protein